MNLVSPLAALPNEILDSVLEYLIHHDIGRLSESDHMVCASLSRLSQCSKSLNRRLNHLLYRTVGARNAALLNGCKTGNLDAIRKVASYGDNLGVVRRYLPDNNTGAQSERELSYCEIPSLQVALKARQIEAYNLLLDFGVGLTPHDFRDGTIIEGDLGRFAKRLAKPGNVAFLEGFVKALKRTPYWKDERRDNYSQAQAVLSRLPFPNVVLWASPALLETLLDNGAPLHRTVILPYPGQQKKQPWTTLGAACLRGDIDVFNLLVSRGAQIDVEESRRSKFPRSYSHIPILVASDYMADTGNTNMLDACIAGGTDINRPCHIDLHSSTEYSSPGKQHVCTTPLLTYIGSIKSWDTTLSGTVLAKQHLTPSEGVAYFIHTLDASVQSPVPQPTNRNENNSDRELHDRTFGGIPSPVELLLVKWGLEWLAKPEFFSAITLLVEHGGIGPDLARVLVRFDGQNEPSKGHMVDVEGLWKQFLELLTPQLDSLDQISKDSLLRRVMVDKAAMRHRIAHPSRWVKVRAIGRATISAIVHAGADINDVISAVDTRTPLHQLIFSFVHTDCLRKDFLHDHPKGYPCLYTKDVVDSFGDFLAFLLSAGADPLIENTCRYRTDEKTAIDTLLSPMKNGRIGNVGGTVEKGLMHFVAKLQGASQVQDYTGDRESYETSFWGEFDSFTSHSYYRRDDCSPKSLKW